MKKPLFNDERVMVFSWNQMLQHCIEMAKRIKYLFVRRQYFKDDYYEGWWWFGQPAEYSGAVKPPVR